MSVLWSVASYLRTQQALQWWSGRQSRQLFREAENIRDSLLQESFTLRRSLELSILDDVDISTKNSRDWLKQIEKFHHALEQLSDRLSPVYIEHSLPLAIQSLVELRLMCYPRLKIKLELPTYWRHESPERSLVILRTLDELLRITLSDSSIEMSAQIGLRLLGDTGELNVHISYPNLSALIAYSNSKDLEHLCQTFQFLTGGQCFRQRKKLTMAWYFRWVTQANKFKVEQ